MEDAWHGFLLLEIRQRVHRHLDTVISVVALSLASKQDLAETERERGFRYTRCDRMPRPTRKWQKVPHDKRDDEIRSIIMDLGGSHAGYLAERFDFRVGKPGFGPAYMWEIALHSGDVQYAMRLDDIFALEHQVAPGAKHWLDPAFHLTRAGSINELRYYLARAKPVIDFVTNADDAPLQDVKRHGQAMMEAFAILKDYIDTQGWLK
jgi:hypothetical protein